MGAYRLDEHRLESVQHHRADECGHQYRSPGLHHNGEPEPLCWHRSRNVINDLSTIRSGASAGATGLCASPAALNDYYTKQQADALLGQKQNTLTFDNAPTENSDNPVKSSGVKAADDNLQSQITTLQNIVPTSRRLPRVMCVWLVVVRHSLTSRTSTTSRAASDVKRVLAVLSLLGGHTADGQWHGRARCCMCFRSSVQGLSTAVRSGSTSTARLTPSTARRVTC